jgi:hypothetical protein
LFWALGLLTSGCGERFLFKAMAFDQLDDDAASARQDSLSSLPTVERVQLVDGEPEFLTLSNL